MDDAVDIIMSTYLGDLYLVDQIESILAQTYTNFRLIIRDDGSVDNTLEIIDHYIKKYPGKIILVPNFGITQNIINGFSSLADFVDAQYIMLCDQDDVWLPEKIAKTMAKMKEMEKQHGDSIPLLAYTDLQLVDDQLNLLHPSVWSYRNLDPKNGAHFNRLLTQGLVWGNTMMFNQPLLQLAFPIPENCIIHDYWISLVASAFGKLGHVDEALILYRQHDLNYFGADPYHFTAFIRQSFQNEEKLGYYNTDLVKRALQGYVFYRRYADILPEETRKSLEVFITLRNQKPLTEIYLRIKHQFLMTGFFRNFKLFVSILRLGPLPAKYQFKI